VSISLSNSVYPSSRLLRINSKKFIAYRTRTQHAETSAKIVEFFARTYNWIADRSGGQTTLETSQNFGFHAKPRASALSHKSIVKIYLGIVKENMRSLEPSLITRDSINAVGAVRECGSKHRTFVSKYMYIRWAIYASESASPRLASGIRFLARKPLPIYWK